MSAVSGGSRPAISSSWAAVVGRRGRESGFAGFPSATAGGPWKADTASPGFDHPEGDASQPVVRARLSHAGGARPGTVTRR